MTQAGELSCLPKKGTGEAKDSFLSRTVDGFPCQQGGQVKGVHAHGQEVAAQADTVGVETCSSVFFCRVLGGLVGHGATACRAPKVQVAEDQKLEKGLQSRGYRQPKEGDRVFQDLEGGVGVEGATA